MGSSVLPTEVIQPMDCRGAKVPRNDEDLLYNDEIRHPELASFSRNLLISWKMGPLGVVSGSPTINDKVYKTHNIGYNSDMKHHYYFCKKCAFTLAEVLITLGIIGVVAALTMPSLVANYKKQLLVNQLKKSVSTIEQGLQKYLADEGETSLSQQIGNRYFYNRSCEVTQNVVNQMFKIAKIKGYNGTYCHEYDDTIYDGKFGQLVEIDSNFEGDGYYLQDGTLFGIQVSDSFHLMTCEDNTRIWGTLWLDVNGDKKGPNIKGRDLFYFYILDTGNLLPLYAKPLTCSGDYYGDTISLSERNWKDYAYGCTSDLKKGNAGCAARIIEEGWKMNY